MIKINFRYNKNTPIMLYIMLIIGIAVGFFLYYEFLMFLGIASANEPQYFKDNPRHAIYLIFGLIPIAMLVPTWIAFKFWSREDEEAELELYDDYAILKMRNEKIKIQEGELEIKFPQPQAILYTTYILKTPEQKIVFVGSLKEKRKSKLSLNIAIKELSAYKKAKK
ncbi:hypothetical protein [Parvimonas micra]|uniref:hypothetical protein n=1 Tax=Parvimonas micra TaxID=33033 RepID=UPI0004038B71|nr:hypothetical protein [Parvimonas micra]